MENLMTKEVNFNGDSLMAAQDKDSEKVYVGVSWICSGIGLTEKQKDRQVSNIQSDIVVSQGIEKLPLKYEGQVRNVLCMELDYLPLWLAKISITPKMKQDSPDTVGKLISYQLKAKEVLANAFVHNVNQIVPKTYKEALYALVESVETNEKLEQENKLLLPQAEKYKEFLDAEGYMQGDQVAKIVGMGRNTMYKVLRENKIYMSNNTPYQKYMGDRGFFEIKTKVTKGGNKPVTLITSKGADFISDVIRNNK